MEQILLVEQYDGTTMLVCLASMYMSNSLKLRTQSKNGIHFHALFVSIFDIF